jgi:hypothetical protein
LHQTPAYYDNLSAFDHYNLINNIVNKDDILYSPEEVLNIVSLDKNKLAKDYSEGMKRRLDIGMAYYRIQRLKYTLSGIINCSVYIQQQKEDNYNIYKSRIKINITF